MKFITCAVLILTLFCMPSAFAQVGIGTPIPNASAELDISSTQKGLLVPRLNSAQRDAIISPATGLMVYNTTSSAMEVNNGTALLPKWEGMKGTTDSLIASVNASGDITTSSTSDVMIPGMTLSPAAGTYLVFFNCQYGKAESVPVSTAQGVIDLDTAYNRLMALPPTNTTHAPVFGSETLLPGVYTVAGAGSTAGIITLDGNGDTTPIFVFRIGGAFNTGASTTITLVNGARARNIFWIAEGALALGANTIMKGTLIAHNAAASAAAGSDLEGRLFSTTGAIAFGPGTAYIPAGPSYIDLGVLSTFVMFTSSGAVGNTGASTITGDVGTNLGAITGMADLHGNIYGPGAAPNPVNNTLATFSVYQNGVQVSNSGRTTDINTSSISVQAIATVAAGETIDIRWKVDSGPLTVGSRIISIIKMY